MRKITSDAPESAFFHFSNHGSVRNVYEMIQVLEHASSQDYASHVNHHKNDIASWVEGVYEMPDLANKIRSTLSRHTIIDLLDHAVSSDSHSLTQEAEERGGHKHVIKHLKTVGGHIKKLEKNLRHTIKHGGGSILDKMRNMQSHHHEYAHRKIHHGILEFILGLAVGLLLGFILARGIGL